MWGAIKFLIDVIVKWISKSILSSLPPEAQKTASLMGKIKNPFSIKKPGSGEPQNLREWLMGLLKETGKKVLEGTLRVFSIFGELLLYIAAFFAVGMILYALLSMFGAFKGKIVVDFEAFEELNKDESIYMDAQNTNELQKVYMQLVSET